MDLSPVTTTSSAHDEKLWLGSKHGTDTLQTITLDIEGGTFDDVIVAEVGSAVGWGYVPSGLPLVETEAGLYELADTYHANPDTDTDGGGADTDTDGPPVDSTAEGHLFESVRVKGNNVGASLFWHGVVVKAQVPGFDGDFDPTGAPSNSHIRYV